MLRREFGVHPRFTEGVGGGSKGICAMPMTTTHFKKGLPIPMHNVCTVSVPFKLYTVQYKQHIVQSGLISISLLDSLDD